MTFDHGGRGAFITGGGSGIGRATSLRLASEGAVVAVIDLRLDAAQETARIDRTMPGAAHTPSPPTSATRSRSARHATARSRRSARSATW